MRLLLIDNYDSFVYNLRQLLVEAGAEVRVVRNDAFDLGEAGGYDALVFSPGPGIPAEAGVLEALIRRYAGIKPMLGICLGGQAIGTVFGARLKRLDRVLHGVQSPIEIDCGESLFKGLPRMIRVGHYHSWVVDSADLPESLRITARTPDGMVMGIRHRRYEIHGVQFHPESILTPEGATIISNFLRLSAC